MYKKFPADQKYKNSQDQKMNSTFLNLFDNFDYWNIYSGDLNNRLVRYSNGWKQSDRRMVCYSSHGLNTRLLPGIWIIDFFSGIQAMAWTSDKKFGIQFLAWKTDDYRASE